MLVGAGARFKVFDEATSILDIQCSIFPPRFAQTLGGAGARFKVFDEATSTFDIGYSVFDISSPLCSNAWRCWRTLQGFR